jgi:dihydrofolate synthase / folylpolyglutamate synthase
LSVSSAVQFIEYAHSFGSKLELSTMKQILHHLGNPHQQLKCLHVAGTNGKGSTSAYLAGMLTSQGYRTGLFTSPHMHCYTERIQINGIKIPDEDFCEITELIQELILPMIYRQECPYPAMFDMMTLMAFVYFARSETEYVVLEVGLGGLNDATNVISQPLVSVITPIDIDHVDLLGSDLKGIAVHKAGIIKPGRPVISQYQPEAADTVIRGTASLNEAPLVQLQPSDIKLITSDLREQCFDLLHPLYPMSRLKIRMIGRHQTDNAALAVLTLLTLRSRGELDIDDEAIIRGLYQCFWAGRLEILNHAPLILIDGAHNLQGAQILQEFLLEHAADKKINFLMGMLDNKDIDGVIHTLLPMSQKVFLTRAAHPKAVMPNVLAGKVNLFGKEIHAIESMEESVNQALMLTSIDEVLVITGSLYLVGDVKSILVSRFNEQREAS